MIASQFPSSARRPWIYIHWLPAVCFTSSTTSLNQLLELPEVVSPRSVASGPGLLVSEIFIISIGAKYSSLFYKIFTAGLLARRLTPLLTIAGIETFSITLRTKNSSFPDHISSRIRTSLAIASIELLGVTLGTKDPSLPDNFTGCT